MTADDEDDDPCLVEGEQHPKTLGLRGTKTRWWQEWPSIRGAKREGTVFLFCSFSVTVRDTQSGCQMDLTILNVGNWEMQEEWGSPNGIPVIMRGNDLNWFPKSTIRGHRLYICFILRPLFNLNTALNVLHTPPHWQKNLYILWLCGMIFRQLPRKCFPFKWILLGAFLEFGTESQTSHGLAVYRIYLFIAQEEPMSCSRSQSRKCIREFY